MNVIPAVLLLLLLLSCSTLRRRKPKASFSTFFSSQPQSSFSPCLSGVSVQKWLLSSFLLSSFLSLSRSSFLLPMEILWGSNEAGFQGGRDGGLRHGRGLAAAGAGATAKEPNRLGGETPIFPPFLCVGNGDGVKQPATGIFLSPPTPALLPTRETPFSLPGICSQPLLSFIRPTVPLTICSP